MRKIKYIMLENRTPILFADHLNHSDVARPYSNVRSAGFCHCRAKDKLGNPQFECYGESISLKMKSHPDDSRDMNAAFGMYPEE